VSQRLFADRLGPRWRLWRDSGETEAAGRVNTMAAAFCGGCHRIALLAAKLWRRSRRGRRKYSGRGEGEGEGEGRINVCRVDDEGGAGGGDEEMDEQDNDDDS
jgi:hypothetical protein